MAAAFFEKFESNYDGEGGQEQLIGSVLNEFTRIITSRQVAKPSKNKDLGLPENYGIPDISSLYDVKNSNNWSKICKVLKDKIIYFEPRIKTLLFKVNGFDFESQVLDISCQFEVYEVNKNLHLDFKLNLKENELHFS